MVEKFLVNERFSTKFSTKIAAFFNFTFIFGLSTKDFYPPCQVDLINFFYFFYNAAVVEWVDDRHTIIAGSQVEDLRLFLPSEPLSWIACSVSALSPPNTLAIVSADSTLE